MISPTALAEERREDRHRCGSVMSWPSVDPRAFALFNTCPPAPTHNGTLGGTWVVSARCLVGPNGPKAH